MVHSARGWGEHVSADNVENARDYVADRIAETCLGIRVTGSDGWSWNAPFVHTKKRFQETHDAGLIGEGHKAGRDIGYCHLEKLHNLEALPPDGFTIACFPHKIRGASAGWTRAVAIIDE